MIAVSFIYDFLGAEYEVNASFEPGKFAASMSGPHDNEPELYDIEIIGMDGMCWAGEMRHVFITHISDFKSVYSKIVEKAYEEYENDLP